MSALPCSAEALKDLLFRLADDDLVLGHRNSEWTGMGPLLEEDIAFASMAQDQLGHALSYYQLLHELGEQEPDQLAFLREVKAFRSCHLVEQPNGDYAFSLVRHYLYDTGKNLRMLNLQQSSYKPLAELAGKIVREHRYHSMHAKTWLKQLARGSEESRLRIQSELNATYPMALGIWETSHYTEELAASGVQISEMALESEWDIAVQAFTAEVGLTLPQKADVTGYLGGRQGYHSEHLDSMLAEMGEVFRLDSAAIW